MKKNIYTIIKRPIVTEKGTFLRDDFNQYMFEVDRTASKDQIKKAIEKLFNVNVESIRTQMHRGKVKRVRLSEGKKPNWKRAIVSLREGQEINYFEGV